MVLLITACAPVSTMQPAAPAEGFGGGAAVAAVLPLSKSSDEPLPPAIPYAEVHWGDGQREFGLVYQIYSGGVYYKQRVMKDFSVRVMVGLPGPWYEGSVYYDYQNWTFAARYSGAYIAIGDDPDPQWIWLGEVTATYWIEPFGLEAALVVADGGFLPAFSVGVRF